LELHRERERARRSERDLTPLIRLHTESRGERRAKEGEVANVRKR
jgi:hypothetical protein